MSLIYKISKVRSSVSFLFTTELLDSLSKGKEWLQVNLQVQKRKYRVANWKHYLIWYPQQYYKIDN